MSHVTFFEDMGIYERNNCVREKFIRSWGRTRMLQCRGIIVWFPHHNKKKYMKWTSDSVGWAGLGQTGHSHLLPFTQLFQPPPKGWKIFRCKEEIQTNVLSTVPPLCHVRELRYSLSKFFGWNQNKHFKPIFVCCGFLNTQKQLGSC